MSWARGFFRLWLVLSLFWVVGMFLAMRPDQTYQEYSAAQMYLGENGGIIPIAALTEAADRAFAANDDAAANRLLAMAEVAKRSPWNKYKTEERKIFEARLRTLKEEIGFIFLPIILAFIIGACLVWALRGFGRGNEAT